MSRIAEGWEILSRRTNNPVNLLLILLQMLSLIPVVPFPSSVTWTIRRTSTGVVRKVTALSEQEAHEKIQLEIFDE